MSSWNAISRFWCASCVDAATQDVEGSSDVGGYVTPKSIETPVGGGHHLSHVGHLTKSSSAYPETGFSHQIRDPYASRVPFNLRASSKSTKSDGDDQNRQNQAQHTHPYTNSHKAQPAQNQSTHLHHHNPPPNNHRHQPGREPHQQSDSLAHASDHDKAAESDNEENSIYTILIRFPPASEVVEGSNASSNKRHKRKSRNGSGSSTANNLQRSKSVHDTEPLKSINENPHRTSIQMLLESPDDEKTPMIRTDLPSSSIKSSSKEKLANTQKSLYSKSLPARGRGINKGIGSGSNTSGATNSSSQRSTHSTTHNISSLNSTDTPSTPRIGCKIRSPVSTVDGDISRIPLDARLVPKQLLKVTLLIIQNGISCFSDNFSQGHLVWVGILYTKKSIFVGKQRK